MNLIFPSSNNPYNLRKFQEIRNHNIKTVFNGSETISYRGPKIWNLVPDDIKHSQSLKVFKAKIKNWKPDGCDCRICKIFDQRTGFYFDTFFTYNYYDIFNIVDFNLFFLIYLENTIFMHFNQLEIN